MRTTIMLLLILMAAVALNADVVINEIMYNSPSYDNEWIELYNTGTSAVNMDNWSVIDDDSTHTPLVYTGTIAPGGYFTIAIYHDAQAAAFPFTPDFDGTGTDLGWSLGNGGDEIHLRDSSSTDVDFVAYDDAAPWPTAPDGNGPSLELNDPSLDNNDGSNWHASSVDGGTPGAVNSTSNPDYTDVANIAALRASTPGSTVYRVTGEAILTYQQTYRNQKYFQDATGGILIDDNAGIITSTYTVGDGVTGLIGTIEVYGNMLEFTPTADPGAATSSGNTVTPITATLADLTSNFDNYQARLVQVQNVTFDVTGSFANGTVYAMHDPTGSYNFRTTFYDVDYIGTAIPTEPFNLVALPNARSDGFYLTARDLADFSFDISDPVLSINPNSVIFGLVNADQTYTQQITLSNIGGSDLTLDTITPPTEEFTVSGVTLPLTLIPQGTATATITLVPVFDRYSGDIVFSGNFGTYSLPVNYTPNVPASGVIINEIMYNSAGYDNEWVELYNADDSPVDLSGYWLIDANSADDHLVIPDGMSIPAGGYFTIALYHDSQADTFPFTPDYDATTVNTWNLANTTDSVILYDPNDILVDEVDYSDSAPWPTGPDGNGPSLELINPAMDNNLGESWQASADDGGTPGAVNSGGVQDVYVSTLAQLRQQVTDTNTIYHVTGTVLLTFQQTYRNQKYFQDDTAGIMIDDYDGIITTAYNVGDMVTGLTGTLSLYNGGFEFQPTADPGAATSTENPVHPVVITLSDLTNNYSTYEARVVGFNGVHFQETGTFENGTVYTLEDADGNTYPFRTTFYDVDYIGTDIPTGDIHVIGIPNIRSDGTYITARFAADMGAGDSADDQTAPAVGTKLLGNFPNPFNPTTTVRFSLEKTGQTQLTVYNLRGEKVKTLVNGNLPAGEHSVTWNGTNDNGQIVASGVYMFRLSCGTVTSTKKTILMK